MKGLYRSYCVDPPDYSSDYRDPEPPPTSHKIIKNQKSHSVSENNLKTGSTLNVKSCTLLYDQLLSVGYIRNDIIPVTTKEIKLKQKLLMETLPIVTERELRRSKTPPHEYILLELLEDEFEASHNRLKRWMGLDEKIREKLTESGAPEPWQKSRKLLRYNNKMLNTITEWLRHTEECHKLGKIEREFTLFLYMALEIQKLDSSWSWLVYEFYSLAAEASNGYKRDQGFGEALINYLFGKYSLFDIRDMDGALQQFEKTCSLTLGRSWTAYCVTQNKDENLYNEGSYLYHVALIEKAKEVFSTDPSLGIAYIQKSIKKVGETKRHPDIEEALLELAVSYNQTNDFQKAISTLTRMIDLCTDFDDRENICNGYLLLGVCYNSINFPAKALECFRTLLENALQWDIKRMVGAAYRYIGEYFLMVEGNFLMAEVHFISAYEFFLKLDMYKETDILSVIIGVVRSLKYYPGFGKLMKCSSNKISKDALIRWKAGGIPFWRETICKNEKKIFWVDNKCLPKKLRPKEIPEEILLKKSQEEEDELENEMEVSTVMSSEGKKGRKKGTKDEMGNEMDVKKKKKRKQKGAEEDDKKVEEIVVKEVEEEIKEVEDVEGDGEEEEGDEENEDMFLLEEEQEQVQAEAQVPIEESESSEEIELDFDLNSPTAMELARKVKEVLLGQMELCKQPPTIPLNERMINCLGINLKSKKEIYRKMINIKKKRIQQKEKWKRDNDLKTKANTNYILESIYEQH